MYITGVILAAGTSSRMGSANKLLLKYKNHTIIEEVLTQLSNSAVDDILIVTGFESDRIENLLSGRSPDRVGFVYNGNFRHGRAESIKCAVRSVKKKAGAVLFMVADKPGVTSDLINRALAEFEKARPDILYVETPAGRGHPIIFSKVLFDELLSLDGDCVGDGLIARYRDSTVRVKDERPQTDIDNEDDYRMLIDNIGDVKRAT